jgi:Spy/CpxP family protein refolding chaperone
MFIKSSIIILLILTGSLIIAGCGRHRFHRASPEKKAEWVVKKITKELDLDEQQQTKLNQIKTELLDKHKDFKGMHGELFSELRDQISSSQIDQDKLNTLFMEKEDQFREMHTFAISKFAEFHSMLTPEQRNKLVEHMDKFKEKCTH